MTTGTAPQRLAPAAAPAAPVQPGSVWPSRPASFVALNSETTSGIKSGATRRRSHARFGPTPHWIGNPAEPEANLVMQNLQRHYWGSYRLGGELLHQG